MNEILRHASAAVETRYADDLIAVWILQIEAIMFIWTEGTRISQYDMSG
jgi:hypothetical protein